MYIHAYIDAYIYVYIHTHMYIDIQSEDPLPRFRRVPCDKVANPRSSKFWSSRGTQIQRLWAQLIHGLTMAQWVEWAWMGFTGDTMMVIGMIFNRQNSSGDDPCWVPLRVKNQKCSIVDPCGLFRRAISSKQHGRTRIMSLEVLWNQLLLRGLGEQKKAVHLGHGQWGWVVVARQPKIIETGHFKMEMEQQPIVAHVAKTSRGLHLVSVSFIDLWCIPSSHPKIPMLQSHSACGTRPVIAPKLSPKIVQVRALGTAITD